MIYGQMICPFTFRQMLRCKRGPTVFKAVLKKLIAIVMATELEKLVEAFRNGLEKHRELYQNGDPFLQQSFHDVVGSLKVTQTLLTGETVSPRFGDVEWVERAVSEALKAQELGIWEVFGDQRLTDFTQFKPPDHYSKSVRAQRYFGAMVWFFRIDFRLITRSRRAEEMERLRR